MKKCSCCKQVKDESEFYWKNKAHTKLNSKCKSCSNRRMTELRRDRYTLIQDYKANKGCAICGDKRHWVLDLHHIDSDTKEQNISYMLRKNYSWTKIKTELDKCEVLCANCHRDYHYHHKK